MTKEVTVKENNAVMSKEDQELLSVFDNSASISNRDIIIPKLLCMQGLSQLVMDGKAKFGEFIDSTTEEVIGNIDEGVDLIPFLMEKLYYISKKVGDDYEFDRIEPVTAANENLPWEDVENGVAIKRQYVMNFYCLRPDDTSLPIIVSFKGMSSKAGQQLATLMYIRNAKEGKYPSSYHITLSGVKQKNDKGTFAVLKVNRGAESTREELLETAKWVATIKAGKAKAHEVEDTPAKASVSEEEVPF